MKLKEDPSETQPGHPVLAFASLADFDTWLAANSSAGGVWLRLGKKGATLVTLSKQEAIDAALCHGWIDGKLAAYDDESWLIRFTPRAPRSKWSKINRKRASELIEAGRMKAAGLAQVRQAQADGRWEAAYTSQGHSTVPADLQAALDASPRASAFFATIDAANRYAILYRVQDARKPDTRARRIEQFVLMLERGETIHPAKAPAR